MHNNIGNSSEGLNFLRVILALTQSLAFAALLVLTAKGWSAVRTGGLSRQEVRSMAGLCVFSAMGDLLYGSGIGQPGDDARPALAQAVLRLTLCSYAGGAAWRALGRARQVQTQLARQQQAQAGMAPVGPGAAAHRLRLVGIVKLLHGNIALCVSIAAYSVAGWLATARWPQWPLLPLLLNDVPILLLYAYIVACIRLDLL